MDFPYRPFIDPVELHEYWWILLLPMSIGIAIAYKAVRVRSTPEGNLIGYWRAVTVMTGQILAAMILLGVASYLLVEVFAKGIVTRGG